MVDNNKQLDQRLNYAGGLFYLLALPIGFLSSPQGERRFSNISRLFICFSCFLFPSPHAQIVAVSSICQIKIYFPRTRSRVVRPGNVEPIESAQPVIIFIFILLVAYNTDHNERYSPKWITSKEACIMTHQTSDSDLRRSDLGH